MGPSSVTGLFLPRCGKGPLVEAHPAGRRMPDDFFRQKTHPPRQNPDCLTQSRRHYMMGHPLLKEICMEKVDMLVKGVPNALVFMFRGFCAIQGKTESEGVIDIMIEYIEKNTAGDKSNLKKVVDEYRASGKKKK
jgi:hypothetical protein